MAQSAFDQTIEIYTNLLRSRLIPKLDGLTTTVVLGNGTTSLLTAVAVTSITGTANEIAASASTGAVTLSLPTALTFTGKTVTGGTLTSLSPSGIGTTSSSTTNLALGASTTGVASLRVIHGTAPTAPVNGDMWTTTAGAFVRLNGTTYQFGSLP